MGRRKEDIFTRAARHLDPRVTPEELRQLLDEMHPNCLVWAGATIPSKPRERPAEERQGRFRVYKVSRRVDKPRPHLDRVGDPTRPLFAYIRNVETLDRWCMLRRTCGNNLCINPWHRRPVAAFSRYEERSGRVPGSFNEEEVQALLEDPSLMEFAAPADFAEAQRRMQL